MKKSINVGLLGAGTVGGGVLAVLENNAEEIEKILIPLCGDLSAQIPVHVGNQPHGFIGRIQINKPCRFPVGGVAINFRRSINGCQLRYFRRLNARGPLVDDKFSQGVRPEIFRMRSTDHRPQDRRYYACSNNRICRQPALA